MDLTSDHSFWTLKNGLLVNFPPLDSDQSYDIVVLGAGITGACVAEASTADGHDVIIVDSRDVGHGSTSASTALLQYEVDTHLIDLIKRHGPTHARMAYQACHESIEILEENIWSLGLEDCAFTRRSSVYLASMKSDGPILREESAARREMGIDAEDWTEEDVKSHFGFSRPAALHSVQAASEETGSSIVQLPQKYSDAKSADTGMNIHRCSTLIALERDEKAHVQFSMKENRSALNHRGRLIHPRTEYPAGRDFCNDDISVADILEHFCQQIGIAIKAKAFRESLCDSIACDFIMLDAISRSNQYSIPNFAWNRFGKMSFRFQHEAFHCFASDRLIRNAVSVTNFLQMSEMRPGVSKTIPERVP